MYLIRGPMSDGSILPPRGLNISVSENWKSVYLRCNNGCRLRKVGFNWQSDFRFCSVKPTDVIFLYCFVEKGTHISNPLISNTLQNNVICLKYWEPHWLFREMLVPFKKWAEAIEKTHGPIFPMTFLYLWVRPWWSWPDWCWCSEPPLVFPSSGWWYVAWWTTPETAAPGGSSRGNVESVASEHMVRRKEGG